MSCWTKLQVDSLLLQYETSSRILAAQEIVIQHLQYLQFISNRDTTVLHLAIDMDFTQVWDNV